MAHFGSAGQEVPAPGPYVALPMSVQRTGQTTCASSAAGMKDMRMQQSLPKQSSKKRKRQAWSETTQSLLGMNDRLGHCGSLFFGWYLRSMLQDMRQVKVYDEDAEISESEEEREIRTAHEAVDHERYSDDSDGYLDVCFGGKVSAMLTHIACSGMKLAQLLPEAPAERLPDPKELQRGQQGLEERPGTIESEHSTGC